MRKMSEEKNTMILDYMNALVNLYGILPKEKLLDIYNDHQGESLTRADLERVIEEEKEHITSYLYIYLKDEYLVSISIMVSDNFEQELKMSEGKPYYVPDEEELLRYSDPSYFEENREYFELLEFLAELCGDREDAERMARELKSYCGSLRSLMNVPYFVAREEVLSDLGDDELEQLKELVADLAYTTRMTQHNGYMPLQVGGLGLDEYQSFESASK